MAAGADTDVSLWRLNEPWDHGKPSTHFYSPGTMVASKNYNEPDPSRMFLIDASKVPMVPLKSLVIQPTPV